MSKIPDDVIADCLLLLPVKPLLRFRCLSKPFCSLIDDPDFIHRHLSRSLNTRSNFILILRDWNLYTVDFDTLSVAAPPTPRLLVHPLQKGGGTEAFGSCNGLLALRNSERDLAFFNPLTRKFRRLPVSEIELPDRNAKAGYVFYGFAYDSVNEDYKLVRMATFVAEDERCESFDYEYEVKVYSLRNDSWKIIKGLPNYLRFLHKPFYQVLHRRGYGVYACNALHWVMPHWPELGVKNSIIAFDVVSETFRQVSPSQCWDKKSNCVVDVAALEGRLCAMCNYGQECIDLWVMKEYGVEESWSRIFSFRPTKWISSLLFLRPLGYSKDGEKMLLEVNDHKLVWYDLNKASVKTVKMQGGPKSFGAEICVGSLVPLADDMETEKQQKEAQEKEITKEHTVMREDFLSVGFKLKL
ncbi:F-box protein CPR1 [Mercurialis annua]|uniref:F-box protein CPR1 n=1 Tax=Mercurialis annua TaxID=3986 RepID=UPI00215F27D2|nr:F-box protein CPR1 [Mercurialis annua]